MKTRTLQQLITAIPTTDGAGVRLSRSIGKASSFRLDPFLMLDEFSSNNPDDYIAGFPDHPHRGFETVTYMLEGYMLHKDHLGNQGELKSGGAQWMAAGRGIIHSEIPQQESGRMHGFQLWLNLPAKEKMKPTAYKDICPEEIPEVHLKSGGKVRAVAGKLEMEGQGLSGPIQGGTTAPLFWDIHLPAGATFAHAIPAGHTAFIYAYEGRVSIGEDTRQNQLMPQVAGELTDGDFVVINALNQPAAFLLVAAKPLHEPIAQYGPFVMNTQDEILQAITDYQTGQLTSTTQRP
ncbi:pirin family protein [Methylotenera mobilis]|uniref:Pirin domain protein n=1 Tax=Methylotenera mobilis (strain JLW8 / ATCC BAA-1282 / DSM 17540) TaxID=583345 RepID=C6WVS3_METML|nr:pirin family protein [Methylotenera mobilis]ACT48022.1 Pirin domain protein [Methylotenera mobilis JLW8]